MRALLSTSRLTCGSPDHLPNQPGAIYHLRSLGSTAKDRVEAQSSIIPAGRPRNFRKRPPLTWGDDQTIICRLTILHLHVRGIGDSFLFKPRAPKPLILFCDFCANHWPLVVVMQRLHKLSYPWAEYANQPMCGIFRKFLKSFLASLLLIQLVTSLFPSGPSTSLPYCGKSI